MWIADVGEPPEASATVVRPKPRSAQVQTVECRFGTEIEPGARGLEVSAPDVSDAGLDLCAVGIGRVHAGGDAEPRQSIVPLVEINRRVVVQHSFRIRLVMRPEDAVLRHHQHLVTSIHAASIAHTYDNSCPQPAGKDAAIVLIRAR